jgi:hypothetical protein
LCSFTCFSCLYCYLFLDVYMFCDVCLVGLSLTVCIFSSPLSHFKTPIPLLFTRTALIPLIPLWVRFCLYYFSLHVPLLSPLNPLQVFVWCLLGALLGCVRGRRPVNVAFALLIFFLVILLLLPSTHNN